MLDPVVARLHGCLVEAVRRRGVEPWAAPLKVSEIYEELVPYREVRGRLGVDLNADYEHALLRLLAGEGGLLRLEPEAAREELRQEAESPYPFVGSYRKFSASDVWITTALVESASDAETDGDVEAARNAKATEHAKATERVETTDRAEAAAHVKTDGRPVVPVEQGGEPAAERDPVTPTVSTQVAAPAFVERAGETPTPESEQVQPFASAPAEERRSPDRRVAARAAECAFCNQPLPVGRRVRYCPSCGSDQRLRPCPRCDEVLERTWRFCVNCGLEVPVVPAPRPPDPDE